MKKKMVLAVTILLLSFVISDKKVLAWVTYEDEACVRGICVVPIPCANNNDGTYTITMNFPADQCGPHDGAECSYGNPLLQPNHVCYLLYVYRGSCPGPGTLVSGPTGSPLVQSCGS